MDKKIEVLINENNNIRTELGVILKLVHNMFFAFISTFGILLGVLVNLKNKEFSISAEDVRNLAFIFSQVEIIILVYYILLTADIYSKASYISYIENKINFLINERLVFWETEVSTYLQRKGTLPVTQIILHFFYGAIYITLICYSYNKVNPFYLIIQIIEFFILCFLLYKVSGEFVKVKKFISNLNKRIKSDDNNS